MTAPKLGKRQLFLYGLALSCALLVSHSLISSWHDPRSLPEASRTKALLDLCQDDIKTCVDLLSGLLTGDGTLNIGDDQSLQVQVQNRLKNNGNDETQEEEEEKNVPMTSVIPQHARVFAHQYAMHGLGHKTCELLMGLHFAHVNQLEYLFDEQTFLNNFRHDDLHWIADLVKRKYRTVAQHSGIFEETDWIKVDDFFSDAVDLYENQSQEVIEARGRRVTQGFYADPSTMCRRKGVDERGCFEIGHSFFNETRELQDLLSLGTKEAGGGVDDALVDRVAIHIRLGDTTSALEPAAYVQILQGLETESKKTISPENVHFVYYDAASIESQDKENSVLVQLRQVLPNAQYHNFQSTEATVKFIAHSTIIITSGSSLSYLSAYLCPKCFVVFAEPKEYRGLHVQFNEETYNKNVFYLDEWVPHFRYLSPQIAQS
ncbi:hypothetical protein BGZ99_009921 [Dissophora globulifera]|uniref:Uncharacterized protein n=1 Tax=Dissophora globulifera TaxID=979702 RepID=A0A9P6RUY9_9FUNG|nr:hypothetical protein BGZ99_009921 [Dissophora globulifera]